MPFLSWDDRIKKLLMNQETEICQTRYLLAPWWWLYWLPRNGRHKCELFINHSVCGTFYSSAVVLQHWFEGCLNEFSIMPQWIPYFALQWSISFLSNWFSQTIHLILCFLKKLACTGGPPCPGAQWLCNLSCFLMLRETNDRP